MVPRYGRPLPPPQSAAPQAGRPGEGGGGGGGGARGGPGGPGTFRPSALTRPGARGPVRMRGNHHRHRHSSRQSATSTGGAAGDSGCVSVASSHSRATSPLVLVASATTSATVPPPPHLSTLPTQPQQTTTTFWEKSSVFASTSQSISFSPQSTRRADDKSSSNTEEQTTSGRAGRESFVHRSGAEEEEEQEEEEQTTTSSRLWDANSCRWGEFQLDSNSSRRQQQQQQRQQQQQQQQQQRAFFRTTSASSSSSNDGVGEEEAASASADDVDEEEQTTAFSVSEADRPISWGSSPRRNEEVADDDDSSPSSPQLQEQPKKFIRSFDNAEQTTVSSNLEETPPQIRKSSGISRRHPSLTFQRTLLSIAVSRTRDKSKSTTTSGGRNSPFSPQSSPLTSRVARLRHHSARPGVTQSSVTFSLPQEGNEEEEEVEEEEEEEDADLEGATAAYFRLRCSSYRRMSAPELPPIPSRARPRERQNPRQKIGSSSSQQDGPTKLTLVGIEPRNATNKGASTNRSSLHSRQSVGRGSQSSTRLPRQPSEGSLGNLLRRQGSKSVSSESGNSSSHPSAPSAPGYLSNRTKSWCTTDKSSGSNFRLETLFERKSTTMSSTLVLAVNNSSKQSGAMNGVRKLASSSINGGRSSVLGITDSDVRPIEDYSSTTGGVGGGGGGGGGMRRIQSDNKLLERNKKNTRNSNITEKSLSVRRIDQLVVKDQPRNGFATRMRKFSSTPAINRLERNEEGGVTFRTGDDDDDDDEDSETESEKNQRIVEWLVTVEMSAEAPEEPEIDYCDEPPQTDTAVHIVYDGD